MKNTPSLITFKNKDKIVHFVFYFVFVFLWFKAFNISKIKFSVILLLIAISYGIIIEVLQGLFTVSRQADVFDALANSLGAFTAFLYLNRKKVN